MFNRMTVNFDDNSIEVIAADDQRDGVAADGQRSVTDLVEQPAKVMRIGTMIKQLLEEVKAAPLDDASRTRLREIHATSIRELEEGLAPELRDELHRLALPFRLRMGPAHRAGRGAGPLPRRHHRARGR
jgi:hypothetical protein